MALEIIEAARTRQRELGAPDDGYIFSLNDKPARYNAVERIFPAYCKKLDITVKSSHSARRTYISMMLDEAVNLNTVRQLAGHSDERTTLRNYCFDRAPEQETYERMQHAFTDAM